MSETDTFISRLAYEGNDVANRYKLPISMMIAQACLESDYGRSSHAAAHNILYGITKRSELSKGKEPDWYPACTTIVQKPTVVERNGELVTVMDLFCSAASYREAVEIWAQYVTKHPHSKSITSLLKSGEWSEAELQTLADHMPKINFGSPKTRKTYGAEIMRIIKEHNLTRFDGSVTA